MPMFNSTKERHDYYKRFILGLGQKYRIHIKDEMLSELHVFIDGIIGMSQVENPDLPFGTDDLVCTKVLVLPNHFIPEGARCGSCGTEIGVDNIVEDKSDSIRTETKCPQWGCGSRSSYYMNNAIAALLKGVTK